MRYQICTFDQMNFLGIKSRYDLDGRTSNHQYICKYCKALLTTDDLVTSVDK